MTQSWHWLKQTIALLATDPSASRSLQFDSLSELRSNSSLGLQAEVKRVGRVESVLREPLSLEYRTQDENVDIRDRVSAILTTRTCSFPEMDHLNMVQPTGPRELKKTVLELITLETWTMEY